MAGPSALPNDCASMYHTARRSLRITAGLAGLAALGGSGHGSGSYRSRAMEDGMPEEPDDWRKDLPEKAVQEVQYIIDQFDEATDGEIQVGVATTPGRVDYLYVKRHILVREEYLGRVLKTLQRPEQRDPERDYRRVEEDHAEQVERVISGIVLLTLTDEHPPTLEALDQIDADLGRGIATPNH